MSKATNRKLRRQLERKAAQREREHQHAEAEQRRRAREKITVATPRIIRPHESR